MPLEHHVHVVEEARAHHVHLARAALLGGGAVEPDRPRVAGALQPLGGSDGRGGRCRPEQVMAARVPGDLPLDGLADRNPVLVDPRQSVVLAHDADDGLAAAEGRHEGRGDLGHAPLHGEAVGLELSGQERRALLFQVPQLRQVPDLHGDVGEPLLTGLDEGGHLGLGHLGTGREGHEGAGEEDEGCGARAEQVAHRFDSVDEEL
jgi:hypothetical protein